MRLKCRRARGTIETRTSATSRAVTILRRGSRATPIRRYCTAQERASNASRSSAASARTSTARPGRARTTALRPSRSAFLSARRSAATPRTAAAEGRGGAHEADDAPRERLGRPRERPARVTERRNAASSPQATASPCSRRCSGRRLEGVTHGVSEVQGRPLSRSFERIARHGARLHAQGPAHGLEDGSRLAGGERRLETRHRAMEARVEHRGLHDLREAGAIRAERKRLERGRVDDDEAGRMERAREVLPRRKVHGRLAAEGAVGGREERRGGLDDGHAAQREGRREARHVAHGSAPQRDDAPVPPKPAPDELLEEAAEDVPRLGGFAVGDEERSSDRGPAQRLQQTASGHGG